MHNTRLVLVNGEHTNAASNFDVIQHNESYKRGQQSQICYELTCLPIIRYLGDSMLMQLSSCAAVMLRSARCGCLRLMAVQLGLNVASSMAMVESMSLHVNRNSELWQPHSSTTSAKWARKQTILVRQHVCGIVGKLSGCL